MKTKTKKQATKLGMGFSRKLPLKNKGNSKEKHKEEPKETTQLKKATSDATKNKSISTELGTEKNSQESVSGAKTASSSHRIIRRTKMGRTAIDRVKLKLNAARQRNLRYQSRKNPNLQIHKKKREIPLAQPQPTLPTLRHSSTAKCIVIGDSKLIETSSNPSRRPWTAGAMSNTDYMPLDNSPNVVVLSGF